MDKIDLNTGQFIFKAGEQSDKVFLLLEGEVGIFLPTNETQQPNHKIQENEIFGEMGVIEGKLRMATARCMSSAKVMSISKDQFEKKIEGSDPFIRGLIRILSSRVRALQKNK
ncbi:MAG: Crp/Fnr family transcriptional regulator [Paracoccaceae bacterium]|tara:strand:+ start:89 stop:427 length:339 start_codon:yes stop_codon:yes gene_type:complete